MNKYLLVVLAVAIIFGCGKNPLTTTLGGSSGLETADNITVNTTWTAAGGPYVISKSIVIKQGVTLTIEPGVTIGFNPDCVIYVDGTIIANGNLSNKIYFKNESSSLPYLSYDSIVLSAQATNCSFSYCEVNMNIYNVAKPATRYFIRGNSDGAGIVLFDHNKLSYTMLYAENSSNLNISNCTLSHSSIGNWSYGSPASYVLTNILLTNGGLSFTGSGVISISNSALENSYSCISTSGTATISVLNCNIIYTGIVGSSYAFIASSSNQTATGNWWGTTNTATIDSKIFDKNDDGTKGTVNYSGYLSSAVTGITGCGW